MKFIYLPLFASLLSLVCLAQSTVVVNNNMGAPASYRTLQGALDSVSPGTVILLQGSGINYGYANIVKPVVIFGSGYFLGQNPAPNTQAITTESQVEGISFSAGSQGSMISGLSFFASNLNNGSGNRIGISGTNSITISRCRFQITGCNAQGCAAFGIYIVNSSNVNINQSYFTTQDNGTLMYLNAASGIMLKNNIIVGNPNLSLLHNFSTNGYSYTFQNNTMYGRVEGTYFTNGNFINNTIIHNNPAAPNVYGGMALADHNVSNVNIFPAGGTNISTADAANTFILYSLPDVSSNDGIFKLKAGSPAIGYGNDATDAGAYGGSSPYVLSGIPAIPNIYFANAQQTGTITGGLKVQLKIKANN